MNVNLGAYDNRGYDPGAGRLKRSLWYVVNAMLFHSWLFPGSAFKCTVLRLFGASVGKDVRIKPRVNIKYPWYLIVGDNVWIGEGVWIDNLTWVKLGS
ncbi:MAG: colanic acid biosynthesis acetyltransferase WcaF, partial [Proteobacteria bacterium]|nr:colanic acid biosynthesis acetyltransferase WcaF [Pseudomonadota bacterium]